MRNAGLDEALHVRIKDFKIKNKNKKDGIKVARRNINNLKYADDTTLMAESEEDLKSLLMKVKE